MRQAAEAAAEQAKMAAQAEEVKRQQALQRQADAKAKLEAFKKQKVGGRVGGPGAGRSLSATGNRLQPTRLQPPPRIAQHCNFCLDETFHIPSLCFFSAIMPVENALSAAVPTYDASLWSGFLYFYVPNSSVSANTSFLIPQEEAQRAAAQAAAAVAPVLTPRAAQVSEEQMQKVKERSATTFRRRQELLERKEEAKHSRAKAQAAILVST